MTKIVIGIDPGREGAICFFDGATHIIEDIPSDIYGIQEVIRRHAPRGASGFTETMFAGPKISVYSALELGISFGKQIGCAMLCGVDMRTTSAMLWKKRYGLWKEPKERSLELARDIFARYGSNPTYLRLAKHHNRAESVLICHHGIDYPSDSSRISSLSDISDKSESGADETSTSL